jgi:nicotinate-nucleotide pyrophosphorylase (carboxylating)
MDSMVIKKIVNAALAEDIGAGDITSLVVDSRKEGKGYFLAKEDFVLCGTEIAGLCFTEFDKKTVVKFKYPDGGKIKKGEKFGTISGSLRSILTCERIALNFLQRLSGISTATRKLADDVKEYGVKILDTRKTTPLLRTLEKYAVKTGGGYNHRFNLSDGILIKDNHIVAAGGITEAVNKAKKIKTALVKIEVEVKNLNELREALKAGVDHVMLDNMKPADVKKAVKVVNGGAVVEVSGGINPGNIREYAVCKPDYISLGFITHSARAVDISLEIE